MDPFSDSADINTEILAQVLSLSKAILSSFNYLFNLRNVCERKYTVKVKKTTTLLLITFLVCASCVNVSKKERLPRTFHDVDISQVFSCKCDIRALTVNQNHVFFAGSNGKFGYLNTADNSLASMGTIQKNGKKPMFRALAKTRKNDFVLSAGNPAQLYKVNFFGKRKLLYQQDTKGTFYDAMAFWNEDEGLAIGDPVDGCMSFLITRDAGKNWQTIDCNALPKAKKGEAAFAASNSNISIIGDKTWVLSGGKLTRVYFSPDKGKTWKVFNTPLVKGENTTGGYSIDFYNDKIGVIFGGDYTKPKENRANKAITTNGGKTWKLVADGSGPGYKSCVKFVPGSGGKELIAVGYTGISYSHDTGKTWTQLCDEGFYTISFLNEFTAYAAGENKISKLIFLERNLGK